MYLLDGMKAPSFVTFGNIIRNELAESTFVYGSGHRKSIHQRQYQELQGYYERLKSYARHIELCGEERNSYLKTDYDATFMRLKKDYMGNDQLLPAYNLQAAVCDEYVAVIDIKPYASDMECFVPLMEKYMKFTMFAKETEDKKYHEWKNRRGQKMQILNFC